ncbi:YgbB family-domain-containing protein [Cladorrhinum sp. PSN332]|nr:YgbB family-domain-containing protein [Cladorrhinum sp. PSN332]
MLHQQDGQEQASDPQLEIGVVILAGGRGTRAGNNPCPKQYRRIAGESVLSRSVKIFRTWDPECTIVIVRHADDASLLEASMDRDAHTHITVGGDTRQCSAGKGLRFLAGLEFRPSHVFIHDAARPFAAQALLHRLKACLVETPQVGAIPVLPISDTVKRTAGGGAMIVCTVNREELCRAQTPQAFSLQAMLEVHDRAEKAQLLGCTDDSSLYEWGGLPVRTVPGDPRNIKLTYAQDFAEAEQLLRLESRAVLPDVRVGHGYDIHRTVPGEEMVLCGVHMPNDRSLDGHSDADVALHALTNAVLATVAADDIGAHFPPSESRWKGVSSDVFLRHAASLVAGAGGIITHVDLSIICEEPKISPYRDAARTSIASVIGIDKQRVSVKAGTNEKIGCVGRQEGVAALATATVIFHGSASL